MKTFEANLSDLQPSQLYICSDKLAAVERSLTENAASEIDPVPVKRLGARIVLTDGHTRAFAAFRQYRRTVDQYETLWLERCRAMHEELASERMETRGTTKPSTATE